MTTSLRTAILFAGLALNLAPIRARADEPKAAVKKAAEAKPAEAEPKADKPAEPKKAADAREAQIDAQVQQWVGQFTQQYRAILTTELNFIRQVCDLTPEQRPKIKAAGEASLKEAALKMAELQGGQMRGGFRAANEQPNPQRIIRESIAKVLQETLTPEQMAKYKAEATQRTALRKRAAIRCVVARLDGTLCLTTEQRDKISQSITAGWQDKWEQWLMLSVYGDQYFPMVPNQHVVSHLDTDQKSVWGGLQKVDFGYYGGGGIAEADDGWWGVEPAKADAPKQ
ncbi:MAG: hypothetical protein IAG10_34370 [Planctomycetaceae bacterium]|nr:hypothetical protein [Planctomycetaceae bacterium]